MSELRQKLAVPGAGTSRQSCAAGCVCAAGCAPAAEARPALSPPCPAWPCCSQQVNDHQTWTLFKALSEMTGRPTTEKQAEEEGVDWML